MNPSDRQQVPTKSELLAVVKDVLEARLPAGWSVTATRDGRARGGGPDAVVTITAADGTEAEVVVEVKNRLEGSDVGPLADRIDSAWGQPEPGEPSRCALVVAPWVSPTTRRRLAGRGIGYADATGNLQLRCDRPAMFIEAAGAEKNPWPVSRQLQSLKGPGAGRAVRALVDYFPPYGIRQLAALTDTSPATLSRVVGLLERDGLLEREPRGPVTQLDWEGTLWRWSEDYRVTDTARTVTYIEPRGIPALVDKLAETSAQYVVTGRLGVPPEATVIPARNAWIYTRDIAALSQAVDIRPTDAGINVLVLDAFDDVVYDRTTTANDLAVVATSQLAVDLLTGPGRSGPQGEELLSWMAENQDQWRLRAGQPSS